MLFRDVNKIDLNSQNLTFLAQMFSANLTINVSLENNHCRDVLDAKNRSRDNSMKKRVHNDQSEKTRYLMDF